MSRMGRPAMRLFSGVGWITS
uniref:Uncharacterized protein n=1 Tax=Arundo donax TaxID=35708 RepID=A0A0A9AIY3_ARUDO